MRVDVNRDKREVIMKGIHVPDEVENSIQVLGDLRAAVILREDVLRMTEQLPESPVVIELLVPL